MKYIRTKDGIFEIRTISDEPIIDFDGKPDYEDTRAVYTTTDERHTYYYGEDVIKEADTIEELCDEFVHNNRIIRFESGSKKYFHYLGDDFDFEIDKKMIEEGIYGAIWVENKGLIYVAKLNEKGDSELI